MKCPICNFKCKKETSYTFKCQECNFIFSNLKPTTGRTIEGIENLRRKNFLTIIEYLEKIYKKDLKKKKILEIGSGDGYFVDECFKKKIKIYGSEASIKDYKILKKKYKNTLFIKFPFKTKKNKFDLIVFNDVLEHLQDLDLVINQIKKLLKKDGLVIINLPSSDGIIYKISKILYFLNIKKFYNRLWQKNQASPHLSYFNKDNLNDLFKKYNFDKILNTTLDSVDRRDNFKRINSTLNNRVISSLLASCVFIFYFFQKILPSDIILIFFKKK